MKPVYKVVEDRNKLVMIVAELVQVGGEDFVMLRAGPKTPILADCAIGAAQVARCVLFGTDGWSDNPDGAVQPWRAAAAAEHEAEIRRLDGLAKTKG